MKIKNLMIMMVKMKPSSVVIAVLNSYFLLLNKIFIVKKVLTINRFDARHVRMPRKIA